MSEPDSEIPEGRCDFELRPAHVGVEDVDLEDFRERTKAVCCCREPWRNGRCIWHADVEDKPVDMLVKEVRNEQDKRLDGAIFRGIELNQRISFSGFTLTGALFEAVYLEETDFSNANLELAKFPGANLQYAKFPGAVLTGAEFPDAYLQRAEFPDADLQGAEFPDADLQGAEFPDAYLQGAEFPDAYLQGAEFPDADLTLAEFPGAVLTGAEFPDAYLQGAEFPDANLYNAEFPDADLTLAEFPDADLQGAEFPDADLRDAQFSGATAIGTDLTHANLQDAVFTRADCRGATFTSAFLYETVLADTRINSKTTFSNPEESFYDSITSRPGCVYEENEFIADEPDKENELITDDLPKDTHRLDAAAWVYRRLEKLHDENALSEEARQFHISKEEAERKRLREDIREESCSELETWGMAGLWGTKTFMKHASKHGESVKRVLGTWTVVIVWFWLLYTVSGGTKDSEGETYWISSLSELATWSGIEALFLNLYFSIITFSTVGYGDISPHGPLSRAFVAVESLLGAVLVALLVYVLGRRVAR